MAETSHERFNAWESESWRLPARVRQVRLFADRVELVRFARTSRTAATMTMRAGIRRVELMVEGRKVPVIGTYRRGDDGTKVLVPANTNARRAEDAALLSAATQLMGETVTIPRSGRPRRGSTGDLIGRWIDARVRAGIPLAKAAENLSHAMVDDEQRTGITPWDVDSIVRVFRRWRARQRT